jgi:hypothetical protein
VKATTISNCFCKLAFTFKSILVRLVGRLHSRDVVDPILVEEDIPIYHENDSHLKEKILNPPNLI